MDWMVFILKISEISKLLSKFGLDLTLKGTQTLLVCVCEYHERATITKAAKPLEVMEDYARFAGLRRDSVYKRIDYALRCAGLRMGPCAAVRYFTALGRFVGCFDEN